MKVSKIKILITGGAGFIGSNFIRRLISKNSVDIVNLDKITYAGNVANLKDIEKNSNYTFVRGDICNKELVNKLSKNCDAIINFAAETHVDRSIFDAEPFIKTDIEGTYVLLESARKFQIKKFIQISTDEVYGSINEGSFKENDCLNPNSPYAASKASADLMVKAFYKTFGIPTVIVRSTNNFGPYQYPEKLIPLFITNLIENKKVPLYGTGSNVRDWIYVEDNCEAIRFVLDKGVPGEIYNVAGGNEKQNIEITRFILEYLKKDESFIEYVKDRPGHDLRYSLDCTKLKKLGWKPKFGFEDAMKKTIEWYKNNMQWWQKTKNEDSDFRERWYAGLRAQKSI